MGELSEFGQSSTKRPRVSVILPAYNSALYISQSVGSILRQTWQDFELIVVNDGSTDETARQLENFRSDHRLRVVNQPNQGVASAANRGLELAVGEFVARMDADDEAAPNRLEEQVGYLSAHPNVGQVGTAYRVMDAGGRVSKRVERPPHGNVAIRWACLLGSPFAHPSLMIRRSLLVDRHLRYDPALEPADDYDLSARALAYADGANLGKPLLHYRVHPVSQSSRRRQQMHQHCATVAWRHIQATLPKVEITLAQVSALQRLLVYSGHVTAGPMERSAAAKLYLGLWCAFKQLGGDTAELAAQQRAVLLRTARLILRPPLPSGWRDLVARMIRLDPGWLVYFLPSVLVSFYSYLRWRKLLVDRR